jgi:hypothetical protein
LFVSIIAAWLLAGCAGTPSGAPTGYSYNEVVIVNRTRAAVTDVTVAATASGRLFSCANVAPRGICSNRFPAQPYTGNPIEVTWSIAGARRHSKILEIEIARDFVAQLPLRGILVIDGDGIEAYLEQVAPGPHL